MKLISEYVDAPVELLTENTDKGKQYYIEGVFAQSNAKNRNGRIYERKIMESAVDRYINEQVKTGRAVGELNHPQGPQINLDKVSHRIVSLEWKGDDVVGKAHILNTPMGKIVQDLLEGGVKLGVSTRGMGTLEERNGTQYVKDDFHLATVDIVQDPSAPNAFVNGIMEGVEWLEENGILRPIKVRDRTETEIETTSRSSKGLYETQIRELKNFLSTL
jgi:hypothetical protein